MNNVLEEYLVKLGIQIDNKEFNDAKKVMNDLSQKLSKNLPASSAAAIKGASLFTQALVGVGIAVAKTVEQVAKADMQYQLLAQRMFMSVQATKAFTLASESMGHNLQEIAWNVELREKYFDLVDQVNKLQIPPEARDMLKQVRGIGHEFDRLKLAGKLSLEWLAIHVLNLNKDGLSQVKNTLRDFTQSIFDKIPIWTKQLAEFLRVPIQLIKTVIRFMGDVKDIVVPVLSAIWNLLTKIWNIMAPWQKQLVVLAALITAAFSPILGPIAAATVALTTFFLLLEDFYAYCDGRKSSELLAPFWEFVDFLKFSLQNTMLSIIVIADHLWAALKGKKHESGLSWKEDLRQSLEELDSSHFAKKAERDMKRSQANRSYSNPEKELLKTIAKGEGTSDEMARKKGFASGYDVTLGYGKYAKSSKPISEMTFAELEEHQNQMLEEQKRQGIGAGVRSSAAGKYQFTKSTLFGSGEGKGLLEQLGMSRDTKFSPEIQDKLALALIEKQTKQFQQGKISQSQYQNILAGRWASIGMAGTDVSKYGQRVGTTGADLARILPGIKGTSQSSSENYNVAITVNAQTNDPNKIAEAVERAGKKTIQEMRKDHANKVLARRATVAG